MEEIDVKLMVKLNHKLSLKHFWVKFQKEGKYNVFITPINDAYDENKNSEMFDIITKFYAEEGYDVIIDEALMSYHLYKN